MNQTVLLECAPLGTATTDPGDETAAAGPGGGEPAPGEPAPKEGDAAPAIDDELTEDQLMWLGRS